MAAKNGTKRAPQLNPKKVEALARVEQAICDLHGAFSNLASAVDCAEINGSIRFSGEVEIDERLEAALGWSSQTWTKMPAE